MSEINERKQHLEQKIEALEKTLTDLKSELKKEEEKAQHEAIENLEHYLDEIDNKYVNLKEFWAVVREEVGDLFKKSKNDN